MAVSDTITGRAVRPRPIRRRSLQPELLSATPAGAGASAGPAAAAGPESVAAPVPPADPETVRLVMKILAETYHGRGSVELGDPFRVLVATVISQRTREEQTTAVSERVFARFPDARALSQAKEAELYDLLDGSQYREAKAPRLIALARLLVERHGGEVPDDLEALLNLPGVGRKTANCVLIYAFNKPALCVDTHMHRISNRLGWVDTISPEQTERALTTLMPRDLWIGSNRLFLQHGRAICVPGVPHCGVCPIRAWCLWGQTVAAPNNQAG
jgi:endonuclease III